MCSRNLHLCRGATNGPDDSQFELLESMSQTSLQKRMGVNTAEKTGAYLNCAPMHRGPASLFGRCVNTFGTKPVHKLSVKRTETHKNR